MSANNANIFRKHRISMWKPGNYEAFFLHSWFPYDNCRILLWSTIAWTKLKQIYTAESAENAEEKIYNSALSAFSAVFNLHLTITNSMKKWSKPTNWPPSMIICWQNIWTNSTPSGGSRVGRHLFGELSQQGMSILAAGSSDWVIYANNDGYAQQ